jgi:ABC-type phosphate transport system substrate-binding protein
MKRWLPLTLAALVLAALFSLGEARAAEGFVVVINAQNDTGPVETSRVAKMFLKRVKRWDNDITVTPVDQTESSEVRDRFTRVVHNKSVSAIKSFWQRMIFSGRDIPPLELASDQAVIDFILKTPGGIGYVSSAANLPDGVVPLTLTE